MNVWVVVSENGVWGVYDSEDKAKFVLSERHTSGGITFYWKELHLVN